MRDKRALKVMWVVFNIVVSLMIAAALITEYHEFRENGVTDFLTAMELYAIIGFITVVKSLFIGPFKWEPVNG